MFQKTTRSSSKLAKIFLRQKIVKRNYSLPPQQLSYVKGEVHPPLLEKTMGQCWEEAVSKYSTQEHLVVVHENSRFTWLELKVREKTGTVTNVKKQQLFYENSETSRFFRCWFIKTWLENR